VENQIKTWRLTMEFSTEQLKPIAEQLAAIVNQELQSDGGAMIREVETGIRHQLRAVGQMALEMVLSQADHTPEREIACECGGRLHYQRRRAAQVLSVFGRVTYERSYNANCACGQGKAPLDGQMGLEPGKVTAGLAALIGMAGVEMAFEYSSRWLAPFLLFEVSENTVRKETQAFGQLQVERDQTQIAHSQDESYLQERLRTETDLPQRVYGSLDGAHVRIEERGNDHCEQEKWREMKVGCWYTVAPVPDSQQRQRHRMKKGTGQQALRAKDIRYFCDLADVEQFDPLFWATACAAQADLAPEVVFVCDGAKWIWRLVETNFPNALQIVDWYHAEERLERVARDALVGETAAVWLEETRTALWHGDTRYVISACDLLAIHSQEASQAATYFRNNAHRMHYDDYRSHGYMIGSGTVESGCKQIVTQRLKRSGAQWNSQGAVLTAKARAAWLSGDWEDLCALRDQLPIAC
jgi:hypothetical protein